MSSCAPGIPFAIDKSSSSILLGWERPVTRQKIENFEVKYQLEGETRWKTLETDKDEITQLVTDLKSNSGYVFKVRAVFDDGEEGPCSGQSKLIKTRFSLAQQVKQEAMRLTSSYPHQYKLPAIQQSVNKDAMTRKCVVLSSSGTSIFLSYFSFLLQALKQVPIYHNPKDIHFGDGENAKQQYTCITLSLTKQYVMGNTACFKICRYLLQHCPLCNSSNAM